ncbi:hypothetical protein U9I39_03980 [Lacticaseibacillus rhamnosus]|uniref:hypothetical protein n=1 Tax=Lacticaseibacillus rhamnosus TaxID=47715 RepID=UPI0021A5076F|nr:hypothetical protein [Lacticaseibacillus rhamnosus]MCT3168961.1 hypothetical protein [Lacticaseibacillus rhamnosus]MCT3178431.1 hypothetical protein [Lacticaseibacillus rhamnosus]MCT3183947.1 hypothetical protein [Lacticaseibacillus rhamnosus]MCT4449521.1 hypothetical protein [Lacticaseibacillus rhamnosus]
MTLNNQDFIGELRLSRLPYYDKLLGQEGFKSRPIVIIGAENEYGPTDFSVLPVSKISRKKNIDEFFDVKVTQIAYPFLDLDEPVSYIRTHKFYTVNSTDVSADPICLIQSQYPNLYREIRDKFHTYVNGLF